MASGAANSGSELCCEEDRQRHTDRAGAPLLAQEFVLHDGFEKVSQYFVILKVFFFLHFILHLLFLYQSLLSNAMYN